jgi:hypothetical protein
MTIPTVAIFFLSTDLVKGEYAVGDEEGEYAYDEGGHSIKVQVRVALEQQQANDTGHRSHNALPKEQDEVTHAVDRRHLQRVVHDCAECLIN